MFHSFRILRKNIVKKIVKFCYTYTFWSQGPSYWILKCFRPVGIYKKDYIDELYSRYDDVEDAPPAPTLPEWCLEGNNSQNGLNDYDDGEPASTSFE